MHPAGCKRTIQETYSVEFDTLGSLYNIEVEVKRKDNNLVFYNNIRNELNTLFKEYTINKLQKEYLGSPKYLNSVLKGQYKSELPLTIRYEVEVDAKKDKSKKRYECIFNKQGYLVQKRMMKLKSTDILDY